ncbi:MAG: hypothetical protein V1772_03690 [Chloroflexota bacterium]
MSRISRCSVRALLTLMVLAGLAFATSGVALSAGPLYTQKQRVGVSFVGQVAVRTPEGGPVEYVTQTISEYNLAPLQVGWYSDFRYDAAPAMPADGAIEYAQLLRVGDNKWPPNQTALRAAVQARPGSLWMIGNEPECPNQERLTPETYAERFHEARALIRGWDPNAKIAIGGIVEPSKLRYRWLERLLAAYQARYGVPMTDHIDVWNIHVQILSEWGPDSEGGYDYTSGAGIPVGFDTLTPAELGPDVYDIPFTEYANVEFFKTKVRGFREWMAQQGEADKPLIISEMGVLYPSDYIAEGDTPEKAKENGDRLIEAFIRESFAWMLSANDTQIGYASDEHRLVQRWLWFSLNYSFYADDNIEGLNGSLYDYRTKRLTRFGQTLFAVQNAARSVFLPWVSR